MTEWQKYPCFILSLNVKDGIKFATYSLYYMELFVFLVALIVYTYFMVVYSLNVCYI